MRRQLLVGACALALAVAAGGAAGAAPEAPLEFTVVLDDGRIEPARLTVPAGRRVKLVVVNRGTGACEFESDEPRVEKVLPPGASSFVVLPPLRPGSYHFTDEYNPDSPGLELVVQ